MRAPGLGSGGTYIRILGGFFLFLGFEFRSGVHHFPAFVCSTFRAHAVRKHSGLAFGTFLGIDQGDIVLLARAIATMTGVPLLG